MSTRRNDEQRPAQPHRLALQMRHARELAGLTMLKLGNATRVAPGHISDIERGWVRSPRVNTMDRLGEPLGLRLTWVKRR